MATQFVRIRLASQPDGTAATVTKKAFDTYYSAKGWLKVEDVPIGQVPAHLDPVMTDELPAAMAQFVPPANSPFVASQKKMFEPRSPFLTAFGPGLVPAISGPMLNTVSTSSTSIQGATYELGSGDSTLRALTNVYGIAPVFSNWTVDSANPNPITLRCSASNDGGATWKRILFKGAASITIEPDADVVADFLALELTKGQLLYLRVQVTVASLGMTWPLGQLTHLATGTTDNTLTAGQGWLTTYSQYGYGPTAILCMASPQPVLVGLVGDSIMNGEADWPNTRGGFTQGLEAAGLPFVKISRSGEAGATFAAPASRRRRSKFLTGITHALVEYGVNDLAGKTGPSETANSLIAAWKTLADRGAKVHQTTITPRTNNGNTAVQSGYGAPRTALNDWIRAGAPVNAQGQYVAPGTAGSAPCPHLSGYLEIADLVESSRNSGLWKVGMFNPSDGTHPTIEAHVLIKTATQAWAASLS